ncbi:MAG: 50S ribosomal protein L5 [bacterium]|nr:50S ribosomal protein L5 [bacterium]
MLKTTKEKNSEAFATMKGAFGYKNVMQAPKLEKVIVSSGVGKQKDKKKLEFIADRLGRITGQKASARGAKQSISNFKTRQGDIVGYQITLRGQRMYDFLDRFLNIALPRTRDFRGISADSIDEMGNYTLGIKEHSIFPETADEDIKDVFGLAVTVVTSSSDKEQTKAFLSHLGFPFKKIDAKG